MELKKMLTLSIQENATLGGKTYLYPILTKTLMDNEKAIKPKLMISKSKSTSQDDESIYISDSDSEECPADPPSSNQGTNEPNCDCCNDSNDHNYAKCSLLEKLADIIPSFKTTDKNVDQDEQGVETCEMSPSSQDIEECSTHVQIAESGEQVMVVNPGLDDILNEPLHSQSSHVSVCQESQGEIVIEDSACEWKIDSVYSLAPQTQSKEYKKDKEPLDSLSTASETETDSEEETRTVSLKGSDWKKSCKPCFVVLQRVQMSDSCIPETTQCSSYCRLRILNLLGKMNLLPGCKVAVDHDARLENGDQTVSDGPEVKQKEETDAAYQPTSCSADPNGEQMEKSQSQQPRSFESLGSDKQSELAITEESERVKFQKGLKCLKQQIDMKRQKMHTNKVLRKGRKARESKKKSVLPTINGIPVDPVNVLKHFGLMSKIGKVKTNFVEDEQKQKNGNFSSVLHKPLFEDAHGITVIHSQPHSSTRLAGIQVPKPQTVASKSAMQSGAIPSRYRNIGPKSKIKKTAISILPTPQPSNKKNVSAATLSLLASRFRPPKKQSLSCLSTSNTSSTSNTLPTNSISFSLLSNRPSSSSTVNVNKTVTSTSAVQSLLLNVGAASTQPLIIPAVSSSDPLTKEDSFKEAVKCVSKFLKSSPGACVTSKSNFFLVKAGGQTVLVKSSPVPAISLAVSKTKVVKTAATSKVLPSPQHATLANVKNTTQTHSLLRKSRQMYPNHSSTTKNVICHPIVSSASTSNPPQTSVKSALLKTSSVSEVLANPNKTTQICIESVPHNMKKSSEISMCNAKPTVSVTSKRRLTEIAIKEEINRRKRRKRRKLEEKYPLPPGVIIKSEPLTEGYQLDNNWSVTSEIDTGFTFDPSAFNFTDTVTSHEGSFGSDNIITRDTSSLQSVSFSGTECDEEPPLLDDITSTSWSSVGKSSNKNSVSSTNEAPPTLEPMPPSLSAFSIYTDTADDGDDDIINIPDDTDCFPAIQSWAEKPSASPAATSTLQSESGYSSVSCSSSAETLDRSPASTLLPGTGRSSSSSGHSALAQGKLTQRSSRLQQLKELLKQKEMEVEKMRRIRSQMPQVDLDAV